MNGLAMNKKENFVRKLKLSREERYEQLCDALDEYLYSDSAPYGKGWQYTNAAGLFDNYFIEYHKRSKQWRLYDLGAGMQIASVGDNWRPSLLLTQIPKELLADVDIDKNVKLVTCTGC